MAAKNQPLTPFGSALAGALGAVFSNAVVYPLDTVKTRLQALPPSSASADGEKAALPSPASSKAGGPSPGVIRALGNRLKRNQMLAMLIKIIRTEGVSGAFKGFSANMINSFSMQFAYFFFHTWLRSQALARSTGALSTGAELGLGAAAGGLAQIFTIPVAVIATRQQLWVPAPGATGKAAKEPSLFQTAKQIISEGGITALWTGLKPGLVLTINPAITYGVFERIKSLILSGERAGGKLSVGEAFWIGALSKSLATVVTYPYIFAKVRLQAKSQIDTSEVEEGTTYAEAVAEGTNSAAHRKHHAKKLGAIGVLKQVYKEEGISGWYQGLSAQIIKAVLCQGILFVSKEQFEDYARIIIDSFSKLAASHPLLNKSS